jgi:hypothetical protein
VAASAIGGYVEATNSGFSYAGSRSGRHDFVLVFQINEIDSSRRDLAMPEITHHRSALPYFQFVEGPCHYGAIRSLCMTGGKLMHKEHLTTLFESAAGEK